MTSAFEIGIILKEKNYHLEYLKYVQMRKEAEEMRLKEGKANNIYIIEQIDIELNLERRLEALGLTEGSKITVLNNDRKGAMTVRFRGTRFAFGKRIADNIFVKEGGAA